MNFIMTDYAVNTMNMQNHRQHPDLLADKAANTSVSSQNAAVLKQCLKQIYLSCPWKSRQNYKVHCWVYLEGPGLSLVKGLKCVKVYKNATLINFPKK